jgi:glutaminyl-tRNA synthetase
MRRGLVDEGGATLRLKMDPDNCNRNMDDIVAYRIKFVAHPHVGAKWCIYPTYDFTHCIVDSLENVTHSLCTLEFDTRRATYYWLLKALGLYMPLVWEFARLNIAHNVMSKRKLQVCPLPYHMLHTDRTCLVLDASHVLQCMPHVSVCFADALSTPG